MARLLVTLGARDATGAAAVDARGSVTVAARTRRGTAGAATAGPWAAGRRWAILLPHGLYYGPVTVALAAAAIDAYQRGSVVVDRYRGRAGQPQADQEAEYARLAEGGALSLGLTARGFS